MRRPPIPIFGCNRSLRGSDFAHRQVITAFGECSQSHEKVASRNLLLRARFIREYSFFAHGVYGMGAYDVGESLDSIKRLEARILVEANTVFVFVVIALSFSLLMAFSNF